MVARNINTSGSITSGDETTVVQGDKIISHAASEADNAQQHPPTDGGKPVQVTPNAFGDVSLSGEVHGEYGAPVKGQEGLGYAAVGAATEGMTGHHPALSAEGLAARKAQKGSAVVPERVSGKEPAQDALDKAAAKVAEAPAQKVPAKKKAVAKKKGK